MLLGLVAPAVSQDAGRRDSSDSYRRRFSVGVGVADPYLFNQGIVTLFTIDPLTGQYNEQQELWRNAFASRKSLTDQVFPIQFGYRPNDQIELTLGLWTRGPYGDERYSNTYFRVYSNTLYRAKLFKGTRLSAVVGTCIAWDRRWHEEIGLYSNSRTEITTSTVSFATVMGLRLAVGQAILGCDLNGLLFTHLNGRYAREIPGAPDLALDLGFSRSVGPVTGYRNGYTWGPFALRLDITF